MGLKEAIINPVIAQLMSNTERQEKYIKQLEANIDVLERAFSQDKEFIVTQNKVLSGKLKLLEGSLKFLHSDCKKYGYFTTAWNKHIRRIER